MGLFRRIGRAFRRVGGVFRRVAGFAKKALDFVKKPLSAITKPFQKLIGKVLDKLPFGQVLKGFVNKFLQNPLSLLAGPVLGPLGGLIGGAGNVGNLLNVGNALSATPAFANPQGLNNVMQMFAASQAQMYFK